MFKVKITNTSENLKNILLTDDLTIEKLKLKYNWFLNASVKNCIIGEDSYGLVWYSGEWICGEWENGTWYSGVWHDGFWKNGKFYSYLLDLAMVMSKKLVILEDDKKHSVFRNGKWLQGDFYNGTFGYDRDLTFTAFLDKTTVESETINSSYFRNGKFHNGLFKNSIWLNGVFYNGDIETSYWCDGKFYNGTFSKYAWFNGYWYGGDFLVGDWYDGYFNQTNNDVKSRFGTKTGTTYQTSWKGGVFSNGEFHSGLNIDSSGNTYPSLNDNLTQWINGVFNGGKWYGGHFRKGIFNNGEWYGGIFNIKTGITFYSNCVWNNGKWYNGLWINGIFKNGHFYNGLWLDGSFENGYMSVNETEGSLLPQTNTNIVYPPIVITYSATTITDVSAYGNGRVTNNGGGMILGRGICWSEFPTEPFYSTSNVLGDGGTMGSFSIKMSSLTQNTKYNFKAYAINKTGLTYGDMYNFTTSATTIQGIPTVSTYSATVTSDLVTMVGLLLNGEPLMSYGFYYKKSIDSSYIQIFSSNFSNYFFEATTEHTLLPNTIYDYYAFAINFYGTGYGSIKQFTTPAYSPPTYPEITSVEIIVNSVTDVQATGKANITYNGNDLLIEVGYCYSSSNSLPTISDSKVILLPTIQNGLFDVTMYPLISGTTYYSRAYAKNSTYTGYGTMKTFKTKNLPIVTTIKATNP